VPSRVAGQSDVRWLVLVPESNPEETLGFDCSITRTDPPPPAIGSCLAIEKLHHPQRCWHAVETDRRSRCGDGKPQRHSAFLALPKEKAMHDFFDDHSTQRCNNARRSQHSLAPAMPPMPFLDATPVTAMTRRGSDEIA